MKKSGSRGVGLVEVLLGSALFAAGMVGLITFTTKSIKTKHVVEAKEDVQGITEVMKTSLSGLPSTPAEYKQVLGSKWVKITDPWGNHYRMIVANNLSSDLCNLGATSLSVELPDGQVVKNVLYLTWTRAGRMVETGQVPSSGNASLSEFGASYARYSGNVRLTRDAIYDVYTLDMYKAENCGVIGSTQTGSASTVGGNTIGNTTPAGGGRTQNTTPTINTTPAGYTYDAPLIYSECVGGMCVLYTGHYDPLTGQYIYNVIANAFEEGGQIRWFVSPGYEGYTGVVVPKPGADVGVFTHGQSITIGYTNRVDYMVTNAEDFSHYAGYYLTEGQLRTYDESYRITQTAGRINRALNLLYPVYWGYGSGYSGYSYDWGYGSGYSGYSYDWGYGSGYSGYYGYNYNYGYNRWD